MPQEMRSVCAGDTPGVETCRVEPRVADALAAFASVLTPARVASDGATLARYARTSGFASTTPCAVLFPQSAAEVAEVARIAGRFSVPLYPISRGKNWGYGDACAPAAGCAVLDLSRMNRIVEVNTELGYAVIEPGVSQGELHEYLVKNGTGLWLDVTGAGPDASLVGNAVDRGFGHTPYGDHTLSTCGMEVVLADGRVLRTGYGHYSNAKAQRAYRYGVGPFLDGLFTQSNFGIVTQIGIWLMPEPEAFAAFFLSTQDEQGMPAMVEALAGLRKQGLVTSTVHVGNDLRVFGGRMQFPWDRTGGVAPLPHEVRQGLRKEMGVGAWNACGGLYGTRETVAAARKVLARRLGAFNPKFLDDRVLARAARVHSMLSKFGLGKRLGEQIAWVKPVYGLLKGIPTHEPLRATAWRVRGAVAGEITDPLEHHVGLQWIAPIVPATGACAREVVSLIEEAYGRFGFDPFVTLTLITERALCCVTNISFDRREPEEVAAAKACYEELGERLRERGYYPYRSGPTGMAKLGENSSVFWDVVGQIKQALDPRQIISPGRYEPGPAAGGAGVERSSQLAA